MRVCAVMPVRWVQRVESEGVCCDASTTGVEGGE